MVDEKAISDAAKEWAKNDQEVTAFPSSKGELFAAIALAFEAGRLYQMEAKERSP